MHRIAILFLPLLRLLLPAAGRHRAPGSPPITARREGAPTAPAPPRAPLRPPVLLRSTESPFLRPYVLTEKERRERRLRRGRRRALWLAVHGVDIERRHIHGTEVRAA
ncbi:hypothetical protein GCM10010211_66370 [Streptomyces albospinus]|uniref:Secreted protein n=1 Tax=Streptomyces albospinus TaxID=285515 RepID=A0ABQ2VLM5_9ACTN|nr:hypothetical protein [Streptomyces albospinus]GGU90495.1 hypothetical protein GCM10010211_66370 [Streptomyces albospinus]